MENKFDVIVIGSGAAGSVMAYQLSLRGIKVAIIEKGKREDPTTFEHNELEMFPRLYKNSGLQTTKDHKITIAQGCTVGGSTVINNAIWLRADLDKIFPEWEKEGAYIPKEDIKTFYNHLEKDLNVRQITEKQANKGSELFLNGSNNSGTKANYLQHNRLDCICCGWCNYGCKYNRKNSMLVTYLPWAEARGSVIFDLCEDATIIIKNKRAMGVKFIRNSKEEIINADKIVVSAGAIGSSVILLQSGIDLDGKVGSKFHLLGGVFITAETDEVIDGFDGIGLTCVAEASEDYVIESYFAPPLVFSLSLGGFFLTHFNRMLNYKKYADAGVMVATKPTGTISIDKKKNTIIDLKFSNSEMEKLKAGIKKLSEIYFNGGATKVLPATFKIIEFSNKDDLRLIDELITDPGDLTIGSAHPQGGNVMSEDRNRGVVGLDFKVHGYENIYVSDTSIFPTNIRANCQATVMAVSQYASSFVAK